MIKTTLASLKTVRDHMFTAENQISIPSMQSVYAPATFFLLTVLFYVAYQFAMAPGWVLGGEMWAEMATNYFHNANSSSYFQKLFATDAGYIPFPPRLIALVGNVLNLPASSIPYFYTWSAIIITGTMIGTFCLSPFRLLVKSDALRFLTAISVLVVADWGTIVFNNFTYFGAFFIAINTALALVDDSEELPWWAWFIPVLMISKPAVLAILPAMIAVSMVSKSRFRWITLLTVALSIGQLVQLVISQKSGIMSQGHESTFLSKFIASDQYFFGLLSEYAVGPNFHLSKHHAMSAGLFFVFVSGWVIYEIRSKANALIITGLSLLLFNVLLNAFALSGSWNRDMIQLAEPPDSHIIVGFFGFVLVVTGAISSLTDFVFLKIKSSAAGPFAALVFAAWFIGTGWLSLGNKTSEEPVTPVLKNSQWQKMGHAIDSGVSPLCVPIDPIGWVYSRNCAVLNPTWIQDFGFERVQSANDTIMLVIAPPDSISEKTLVSLAILVRPLPMKTTSIAVKAIVKLNDRSIKSYMGNQDLTATGGLILLTGQDSIPIKYISSIEFIFSSPVEVAFTTNEQNDTPVILWMGQ